MRCACRGGGKIRPLQTVGNGGQRGEITAFTAKVEPVHHAQPVQNLYCTEGKALCRTDGTGERELQHYIRPTHQGGSGTGKLVKYRRLTPLHIVAGHQTHNGTVIAQLRPDLLQLQRVAQMQGVVFADDCRSRQKMHLLPAKIIHIHRCAFRQDILK